MISPNRMAFAACRLLLLTCILLSPVTLALAQSPACSNSTLIGHWLGTMTREGADVSVAFDFVCTNAELQASFTSMPQRAMEYPFDSAKQIGNAVELLLGGDTYFSGQVNASDLAGTFKDENASGTFHLKHIAEVRLPYSSTDVVFRNGDVTLSGSLYIPRGDGPFPAIVMLQGSGPEARWGANRFWADYFGRRGIATLICDKRGSGKSTGDWQTADFNSLAGDALAAVDLLQHTAGSTRKGSGFMVTAKVLLSRR